MKYTQKYQNLVLKIILEKKNVWYFISILQSFAVSLKFVAVNKRPKSKWYFRFKTESKHYLLVINKMPTKWAEISTHEKRQNQTQKMCSAGTSVTQCILFVECNWPWQSLPFNLQLKSHHSKTNSKVLMLEYKWYCWKNQLNPILICFKRKL